MKKHSGLIIIGIIILVIILGFIWTGSVYNSFVELEEKVKTQESAVDVALVRRADLIPNLVSTVKGYAAHEEQIINDITKARENLLKADDIDDKSKANSELTRSLNALMVVVENYPDLKASTNFINLQDELAGTENRIAIARKDYNEAAQNYNTAIKKFPKNILAAMFDFDDVDYFEATEEQTKVPEVNFN